MLRRVLLGVVGGVVALSMAACASVQAQPAHVLTYVAMGASDAVGVGASNPETDGWVPRLGARLGPSTHVVNLGVSGSTLSRALQEQLGPALDANPDIITVWLAVNDFNSNVPLESYAADLDTLLGQLQMTHAQVLVGNIPDLGALAAYRGIDPAPLQARVDRWNAAIADTTARHGDVLVDLHAQWQELAAHPEYVSTDGFHPSSEGYQALADVFAGALQAGAGA